MYYNTPHVEKYISFIKNNRALVIAIYMLLSIIALSLINPSLFSTDERFWLQDSSELKKTEANNLKKEYVSKISLHVNEINSESISELRRLNELLLKMKTTKKPSSLLSQKHFYNDIKSNESELVKVINTEKLSDTQLAEFAKNFSSLYKPFVNIEQKELNIYMFTEEPFNPVDVVDKFDVKIDQVGSEDNVFEFLLFAMLAATSIILLFKLIFKSWAASITSFSVIGLTLVFSLFGTQLFLPDVSIHMSMSLIIVSIALLDYLYFYYRWHVSQYNADKERALIKSLNRNVKPAFWTTLITVVGLAPLLFVDSDMINVLSLSAILASIIAYLLNISLLPAMLSYFHVDHPKVPYGRYCYYFANKEFNFRRKYLVIFIFLSAVVISLAGYSFMSEPHKFISNHHSHNVIRYEVKYDEINVKSIEALYHLHQLLRSKFKTVENIESISTVIDSLLDMQKNQPSMDEENLQEALFFIRLYDVDKKLLRENTLPVTIILKDSSTEKAEILKFLSSYENQDIYFNDIDTLISMAKMNNTDVLAYTLVTALLIIATAMGLIFRNIYLAGVAFLVNTIPMAWFAFVMYLINIPFSLEVLIAMTISLGLASDATIHFAYKYWRARFYGASEKRSLEIVFFHAAVPVSIGSIVLAATFFLLSFSSAITLQIIGLYASVLILMSLAVDLFILPILLLVIDKYIKINPDLNT